MCIIKLLEYLAKEDLNFHADGNINMEAKKNINMKSGTDVIVQALKDIHNKAGGNRVDTAGMVYMNSSVSALAPKVNKLDNNEKIAYSVSARVPEHHPWKGASKIQEVIKPAKGKT